MCADRTTRSSKTKQSRRDQVAALANGLLAIEAFSATRQRLSLSDVAKQTGLTRAAARRYLLTLTNAGYAEFDGKFFQLTPRVLRLGHAYLSSTFLPKVAQPFVEELGELTEEAVAVAVLDGPEALIIASSQSQRIVGIFTRVGTHLPALTSSTGRILLAGRSDDVIQQRLRAATPIKKLTSKTKTSPEEILDEIRRIRKLGFALNDEEIEIGLRVIAVPVRNGTGSVVAALCVSTHSGRFHIDQVQQRFFPILATASEKLGRLIA
jgi:IclR family transcriptional regulator, pca regulon regulatory protein